uniref:NADH-ubiquinone oxidoreductase chain 2 n=1 Tax=Psammotettix sp. EMHAU-2015-Zz060503 TaxID=2036857 RepID=A0A343K1F1_9HEMI|nr:NADH dehydrogenase subunit 2 [Psammotettix sp. EMHAU-2015-Zz060503]
MLLNSTKLVLMNAMMIGVIMVISSNNWLSMWMGLEICMLSFIPFMHNKIKSSSESMMKYFIVQSIASTLFMFSVICMLIGVSMTNETFMTISMLIKLGSAPFHNWVLMVIENISYMVMFNLLTIMKIPPMLILYQINSNLLMMPIILSMSISSIMCINQSSLRKTFGFSSIYNLSLMLMVMNKMNLMISYLVIYSVTMIPMVFLTFKLKINFLNQMVFNDFSMWIKLNLWINMLSMGGFPPLAGFLGKIMVLQHLISTNQVLLTSMLILTSTLVMMFYTRMAFSSMMSLQNHKKWSYFYKTSLTKVLMGLNFMASPMILTLKSIV